MEDGSNDHLSDVECDLSKNGVVSPIMAKCPGGDVAVINENKIFDEDKLTEEESISSDKVHHVEKPKVNGDNVTENKTFENDSYDSESDALVIDESAPKKHKNSKKSSKTNVNRDDDSNLSSEVVTHSNPYFNESLFELSQLHQKSHEEITDTETSVANSGNVDVKNSKLKIQKKKNKPKPKLKEYAQYLGLQPTVQFKCSKCGRAGFESLSTLHEHVLQCNSENVQETLSENSCSGFKLTRKVFLCSACGTYYENWNLYMHMLEFHRRYICLYCLGMFSILEDLCQHIQSRHNLEPGHKKTLDEFFNVYNEPCYVVCCECNKLFSEQDNFFYHNCINSKSNTKTKKPIKQQITPENHVTGETEANEEDIDNNTQESSGITKQNTSDTVAMETSENLTDLACKSEENVGEDCQMLPQNSDLSAECEVNDKVVDNKDCDRENSNTLIKSEPTVEQSMANINETLNDNCTKDEGKLENVTIKNEIETNVFDDETIETRKVPKLSLKLPKPGSYPEPEDSDDSEKLMMEVDQIESENEIDNEINHISNAEQDIDNYEKDNDVNEPPPVIENGENHFQVAGCDIPVIELELEQPLDKFDARILLQKCLKTTVATCIYCNHARKIAVNGKQLALHCIAEHRFSAVVNSITAEELIPESFVNRFKESLDDLEQIFFNLESSFSNEAVTFSHLFECFQCHFSTTIHKELYLHNRKFHSKNLLLCIMCKSNFYSYSELICHLCPGLYVLDYDLLFRCCMCVNDDLPSSFRLMVHLRKRHNVCDVCLEMCHTQYRLSNHVWKHKLHHFCYRCGIAYRNKPDITRHLFWKHGTESVLCKKCLQKKWPHVYHFCVPPASFTCDECGLNLTRAVSLKVHKRLHTDERKHTCTFEGCTEAFVSKKLMLKHEIRHREPLEELKAEEEVKQVVEEVKEEVVEESKPEIVQEEEKPEDKPKPKIDVLDLPALNLSESDSSDSESEPSKETKSADEKEFKAEESVAENDTEESSNIEELATVSDNKIEEDTAKIITENPEMEIDNTKVIQNIWDNFKNYQASKEKLDNMFTEVEKPQDTIDIPIPMVEQETELTVQAALMDHDYCIDPEKKPDATIIEAEPALTLSESVDHDYCSPNIIGTIAEKPPLEPVSDEKVEPKDAKPEKKVSESSSSSSSDTDATTCSCGSNCSCSSSDGSSSSSSDSSNSDSSTEEGRQKQLARRRKRKERAKKMKEKVKEKESAATKVVDVVATADLPPVHVVETPIQESDLETDESETDEEFYDEAPQKLAKKMIEEKRLQFISVMGPNNAGLHNNVANGSFIESTSRPPTPPAGSMAVEEVGEERKKKKSKSKKRKKRKSERREQEEMNAARAFANTIADVPIPPYYQQFHQQLPQTPTVAPITLSLSRNSPVPTQSSVTTTATVPGVYRPKVHGDSPSAISRRDSSDSSLRSSKRRRVPNKFYGYSSDEEQEKGPATPIAKWRKMEAPQTPKSPLIVPPITIKTAPQPTPPPPQPQPLTVEPISIRTAAHLSDFRVRQRPRPRPMHPPSRIYEGGGAGAGTLPARRLDHDSASDSNDSSSEEQSAGPGAFDQAPPKPMQPQLYCYCRCPYDEVSEMIGCDASDCAIEWFHFECVGIMVPPKGQWFCPDCRKKKQQRQMMQSMN